MSAFTNGPVHARATWRRPTFTRTTLADPRWRVGILRSSCGHTLGLYALYGARQAALQWRACR